MAVSQVVDIVKTVGETVTGLVKDLTGMKVVEKVAGGIKNISDQSAKLVKKVPVAGGLAMYVFKRGGSGVLILGKHVDKAIGQVGDLANTAVDAAEDTIIWTLVTTRGSIKEVGKTLTGLNSKRGGRRHLRNKRKTRKGSRHTRRTRRR